MDVTVRTLSEFSLFADLSEQILHELASFVSEHTYASEQVITFRGEPCQGVYMIVQGLVSLRRLSVEGREYILDYLGPGECFNLVPVLDGGRNLATMEATALSTVYMIPCDRFQYIVRKYQDVAIATLEHLATRVRYLSDTVEDLALYTVRTRLARFLLTRTNGELDRPRRWTQEEIASHIGTVRDVVGRTLRTFAREGMIRRERGRLVIRDRNKLEQEAMQE